ncbi:MAG: PorT family protein [Bacteroidales bacterium]|nr:PorT family protein [Bacteroidales bacterium]
MNKLILCCILVFTPLFVFCQNEYNHTKNEAITLNKKGRQVRFGAKIGFNSSIYLISDLMINDVKIREIQNNYKIGYHFTVFTQVNFNKHFIQPELSYQINRSELSFDKSQKNQELMPFYATIKSELHHIELPILWGYNFINKPPYGMAFFIGPKITYLWRKKSKIEYQNFDVNDFEEKLRPLNLGCAAGVSVNISQFFFDFRYEQSFFNMSKEVRYKLLSNDIQAGKTHFNRRESVLSFSVGILF